MELMNTVDVKARWTHMEHEERKESGQTSEEAQEEERKEREAYEKARGTLRFTKLTVTDFPSSKEIVFPYERPDSVEVKLQGSADEMSEVARKYIKEKVNREGNIKESYMTKVQETGRERIC